MSQSGQVKSLINVQPSKFQFSSSIKRSTFLLSCLTGMSSFDVAQASYMERDKQRGEQIKLLISDNLLQTSYLQARLPPLESCILL